MNEMIHAIHSGDMMLVIYAPDPCSGDYTVGIGDYSDVNSFVPRHAFTFAELPIAGRLLSMAYPWIFQHRRGS